MAADTSSAPAARTPVVGAAAAALAALIVDPIFAKSEAAAVTNSGAAITKDIPNLPIGLRAPGTLSVEHSADAKRTATHTQSIAFSRMFIWRLSRAHAPPAPCLQL